MNLKKIKKIKLSSQQRAVIRTIAKEQQKSLLRLSKNKVIQDWRREFNEEGYDCSSIEILETVTKFISMWERVEDKPEDFPNILDSINMAMVRHSLIQDFDGGDLEKFRPIHRLLNLHEELNQYLN